MPFEGIEVEADRHRFAALAKHREVISARGQERVRRHPVALRGVDRPAAQPHRDHPLARGPGKVVRELETFARQQEFGLGRGVCAAGELLLEQGLELPGRREIHGAASGYFYLGTVRPVSGDRDPWRLEIAVKVVHGEDLHLGSGGAVKRLPCSGGGGAAGQRREQASQDGKD